jgi:multiple sugar transport system permease protein
MKIRIKKKNRELIGIYLLLIVAVIWTLFPFYWTAITSFKTSAEIAAKPITYWPKQFTLENYVASWKVGGFSGYFRNSLKIALISTVFTVLFATMDGYALARYKFKGKNAFLLLLLCTQFFPTAMLIIPLFKIFNAARLINNHLCLILTYTVFHIPFNAALMKGFISGIPVSLEEAAMVDGCSRPQAVVKILLPLLLPGMAAVSAYSFISCWNEYLYALMFMSSSSKYTIPVGLSMTIGEYSINYGQLCAGSMIALVPIIIMFAYVQKYMVSGLGSGAVKE